MCQTTPGFPLCRRSNNTPAGKCLHSCKLCPSAVLLGRDNLQKPEYISPAYQRRGNPSSSNQGVFTASLTSGGNTCCTINACEPLLVPVWCTRVCVLSWSTYPKMIKGTSHKAWKIGAARKQHLKQKQIDQVEYSSGEGSVLGMQDRTCSGAGGPSTVVTSLGLNVSLTGICSRNIHRRPTFYEKSAADTTSPQRSRLRVVRSQSLPSCVRQHLTYVGTHAANVKRQPCCRTAFSGDLGQASVSEHCKLVVRRCKQLHSFVCHSQQNP